MVSRRRGVGGARSVVTRRDKRCGVGCGGWALGAARVRRASQVLGSRRRWQQEHSTAGISWGWCCMWRVGHALRD